MRVTRVLERIWKPLSLVGGIFLFAVLGFAVTQPTDIFTAFYWGITTLSTVGYGDVYPHNTSARLFAMLLMVTTIGVLGYLISTITVLAMQVKDEEMLGLGGTKLTGHTVLLGWNQTSRAALRELVLSGEKVAIMTRRQDVLVEIRTFVTHLITHTQKDPVLRDRVSRGEDVFIGFGDYTEKSSLSHLNLPEALRAIIASDDDARNVMTALILKELAPHLRIVVALLHEHFKETLEASGITYVISPSEMGGRIIAEAAIQPEVAMSVDEITNVGSGTILNEYEVTPRSPLSGLTFGNASKLVLDRCGGVLTGIARRTGGDAGSKYRVTIAPPRETPIRAGDYALVLTSLRGEESTTAFMGTQPGRARERH